MEWNITYPYKSPIWELTVASEQANPLSPESFVLHKPFYILSPFVTFFSTHLHGECYFSFPPSFLLLLSCSVLGSDKCRINTEKPYKNNGELISVLPPSRIKILSSHCNCFPFSLFSICSGYLGSDLRYI